MVYDLSSRLLQLRKSRDWTQKELGDRVEVSDSAIGNYENDVAVPSLQVAAAIADTFNVSLDYLAEGEKCKIITAKGLSDVQIQLLTDLVPELAHSSGRGPYLSLKQQELLARIITEFVL